jgi:hypothetical protein
VTGNGDADAAIAVAVHLRAQGFHVSSIRVGDAAIEMPVIFGDTKPGNVTAPRETKSIIEEWGGPAFAKAMEDAGAPPDLVDDEEQPAVRS